MGRAMMIVALGLISVMGKMLYGLNERHIELSERGISRYEGMISRNIASSGASIAVSQLCRDFSWREGLDSTDFNGGSFRVGVEQLQFDTLLTISQVRVTSISSYCGGRDTVQVVLAKPPFSYYAQFSDQWPTNHYFITGDTIYGPVHTNQRFGFSGYPVFYSKVSSVASDYKTLGVTNPQFLGGTDFGCPAITLPTDIPALRNAANDGGDVYSGHVWLRFNADGSYNYGNDNTYSGGTKWLSNYNGTIMTLAGGDIHVKGTVHGQVTIYSGRHIYIEDDLVYAHNPRIYSDAQDMVGLVATNDVIVVDNTPNRSDCEIHGAIMGLSTSFKVQNYSSGSPRGTLRVIGSIVQRTKGAIGTFTTVNGQPVLQTGYFKDWKYDERFLNVGPPEFPLVPKVVIRSWME